MLSGEIEDDPAINAALRHTLKNYVDVFQLVPGKMRSDFAVTSKFQRLVEILPCPNDGAADGDAFEHGIENRQTELTRRQTDERHGAMRAQKPIGLLEGFRRYRGHQHAMRTSGFALKFFHHIRIAPIENEVGTERFGQSQLVRMDVDG